MRKALWLCFFWLVPAAAWGDGNTSAYTKFDLEKTCRQVAKPDEYVFAGTWECPGHKGLKILVSDMDERSYVGFGARPAETCAFSRTFDRFNTALSPVEWRLRNGKPFAVIQRWRVTTDEEGGTATWLVVTKLTGNEACPVHYVAGSYPNANAQAREAADDLAAGGDFNCATDIATVDSTVGPPPIAMISCQEVGAQ
jgi:hypothetical protein